jgi:hypothetical protein
VRSGRVGQDGQILAVHTGLPWVAAMPRILEIDGFAGASWPKLAPIQARSANGKRGLPVPVSEMIPRTTLGHSSARSPLAARVPFPAVTPGASGGTINARADWKWFVDERVETPRG